MTIERPQAVSSMTYRERLKCGNFYVTTGYFENGSNKQEIFETFVQRGKSGSCFQVQSEIVGRLLSLLLKHHVPVKEIHEQLNGIVCSEGCTWREGVQVESCAHAINLAFEATLSMVDPEGARELESSNSRH